MKRCILSIVLGGLALGIAGRIVGEMDIADAAWALTTAIVLVPLSYGVLRDLLRGDVGVDIIALLAMAAALALGEYLAGAIVALMLSGGQALEEYADRRARAELTSLLGRAPRVAHRFLEGRISDVTLDEVAPGQILVVKPGEVVPVDGLVSDGLAVIEESALTGEPLPVERSRGEKVRSGTVNAGGMFHLRAVASARDSTYAAIVRLVEEAQATKAPFVRLADRYALIFLPVTLAMAGAAWAISGEPVRALAVLVVATPCPLILAAPVAIVAGISRAAGRGVIVKGGGALETLARAGVLLFDKTGTLTAGRPRVSSVEAFGSHQPNEVLWFAAALDQASPHVLAASIVRAARDKGFELPFPTDVAEQPGRGISGRVEGRLVSVGKATWLAGDGPLLAAARAVRRRAALENAINVFIALDGKIAGAILLEDPIRPDGIRTIRSLRRAGVARIVMVTGDHADVAQSVGTAVGIDRILSERSPADKVDAVRGARAEGTTIMVGDGINDAPALAAADIGVAMGSSGATASSEAADVVLMVDRLERLAEALSIARRSRAIALQSVLVGMGLSFGAMVFAAGGLIAPVAGAFLQEGIDVAVIVNALRALTGGIPRDRVSRPEDAALGARFRAEHRALVPAVDNLRSLADRLDDLPSGRALEELRKAHRFLVEELMPHEQAEDARLYPVVARLLGGEDPTGTMTRAHLEISHLIRLFGRLLEDVQETGWVPDDVREFRRVLYGLHAVLQLHFAQEEEAFLSLVGDAVDDESALLQGRS